MKTIKISKICLFLMFFPVKLNIRVLFPSPARLIMAILLNILKINN